MSEDCNLQETQRKSGTLCKSMGCTKCPPYREKEKSITLTTIPPQQVYDALGLLADKMEDRLSSLSSSTKEWCDLTEEYIKVVREMLIMEGNQ